MGRADHNRKRMLKLREKKALELKTVKNRLKRQRDKARGKELIALGRKKKPSRLPKVSEQAITGTYVAPPIQADIKRLRAQLEAVPSSKTRNFTANEVAHDLVASKLSESQQKVDALLGKIAGIKPSVGRVDLAKKVCAKSGKKRQQYFKDIIEPLLEVATTRRFLCMTILRVVKAPSSMAVLVDEGGLSKQCVAELPAQLRAGDVKAASSLFHAVLKLTSRALRGEDVLAKSKVLTGIQNAQLRSFRRSRTVGMLSRRLDRLRPLSVSALKPLSVALGAVQPGQVMLLAALAKAVNRKFIVTQNTVEDGAVVQKVFWQNFDDSA